MGLLVVPPGSEPDNDRESDERSGILQFSVGGQTQNSRISRAEEKSDEKDDKADE